MGLWSRGIAGSMSLSTHVWMDWVGVFGECILMALGRLID